MSLKARVAAALLLTMLWFGPALAQPTTIIRPPGIPDSDIVKLDPRAIVGVLDNGVHYAVMRRSGARDLSMMLYIKAGSANETQSERGIAHFLEHMAFNGSRSFPTNTIFQSFENIGVAIGRDQNAQTEFRGTTFEIDLSEITSDKVDLAMKWLRDVADGLNLDQAEVDRERGTIMSEYRSGLDATQASEKRAAEFEYDGLLGPTRDPIGEPATIGAINAKMLRAFYEKWYRPENAIVIMVGDAPASVLKDRVEAAFGSWRSATPKPQEPDLGVVKPRKLDVLSLNDARANNVINVCHATDKPPVELEDVNTHQHEFVDLTWTSTLQKRLNVLSHTANPPFISASVGQEDAFDRATYACVGVTLRDGDWRAAVQAVAAETRRMELYGITEDELHRTKAEYAAQLDATVGSVQTLPPHGVAQLMLRNLTTGGTFDTAEEDRRVGILAMDRTTKATIDDEFHRLWTKGAGPLIVFVGSAAGAADDIKQAWTQAISGPAPSAPEATQGRPWAYTTFGTPGQVVHREVLADIDTTRLEFANGLRVNFKQTENASDQIAIRIRFGAGQREIPVADLFTARNAAGLLNVGGLGKNTADEVDRVCEGHSCSMEFAVRRDNFLMAGATRPSDLDVELQVLTAYLTDPGFRPEAGQRWRSTMDQLYRQAYADASAVAGLAIAEARAKPHVDEFPSREKALAVTTQDMARVLGGPLKRDALEVTIVGDVDEATVTAALAKTLGAIPPRDRGDHALADAPVVRYLQPSPPPIHATHEGPADKAVVTITWPLFVWTPDHVREQRAMDLLSLILRERLLETIRHDQGKTYTPMVEVNFDRGGDQGSMSAVMETSPEAAEAVARDAVRIGSEMAGGAITAEVLERERRPVLDSGAIRELTNEWWIGVLDGSWARPDQLAAAKTWQDDYAGLTLADIKAEAARWLKKPPLVVVVTPKAAAVKP